MIIDTFKIVLLLIAIILIIIIHKVYYDNEPKISHRRHKDIKVVRKIRCPPPFKPDKIYKIENIDRDVLIYNDSDYIKNVGFKNELIYNQRSLQTPDINSKLNRQYDSILIKNGDECIDKNICYDFKHKEYKTDLPIANINVKYLLDKNNSVKLSEQIKRYE